MAKLTIRDLWRIYKLHTKTADESRKELDDECRKIWKGKRLTDSQVGILLGVTRQQANQIRNGAFKVPPAGHTWCRKYG